MHDNPRATEEEQELVHEDGRGREEEAMRGAEAHDPDELRRRARREAGADEDDEGVNEET